MKLLDLELAVTTHVGNFHCSRIGGAGETKIVGFQHRVEPPIATEDLPPLGRLVDFFDTFGGAVFYRDEKSGEAAVRIAAPSEWQTLKDDFTECFDGMSAKDRRNYLPAWVKTCLVIGEMPDSGNYVLMPTAGDAAGHVFEFDHDGFEFTRRADDLVAYGHDLLSLDSSRLTSFASHLRFIEGDPEIQWWIDELRDNRGEVVATDE